VTGYRIATPLMYFVTLIGFVCLSSLALSLEGQSLEGQSSEWPSSEWQSYGGDSGGQRYVNLNQITPANVSQLREAWHYRTGDNGEGMPNGHKRAFEATPIFVDGTLFFSTPYNHVHAVDAASGEQRWHFDSKLPQESHDENTSRGVSYWRAQTLNGAACEQRIVFGTFDARLIALDALTGKPCTDFGNKGSINLNVGSRPRDRGSYLVTSPPAIWQNIVITGAAVGDNRAVDNELGVVRAFDVQSGELLWSFDPIPRTPDHPAFNEWEAQARELTGAANAWSVFSIDSERGLVFIPVGSASPDFYGGERKGDNRYANSLVVLKAATGEFVWAQQLVHHDLWDYDLPSQPVLIDLKRNGETIPAVVQATKMGMLFVFQRETGEPLFSIEEKPVPQGGVDGEVLSPTQPFSSLPPLVPHEKLTPDDAWGITFWDRGKCRKEFERYRSEGIYTPPSLQGTIEWPSYAGGSNWGSVSFDSERQLVIANTMRLPFVVQLIPRAELLNVYQSGKYPDSEFALQTGTPYGMRRQLIKSPLGIPCTAPPWGTLSAVNLTTGKLQWEVPLGTTEDIAPWPFNKVKGVPNMGGSMITKSGLIFIGAAADNYLRAFNSETGEELWKGRLPAGGQATPMSYELNGKQFIVIAAGGHGGAETTLGDYVVAFALP